MLSCLIQLPIVAIETVLLYAVINHRVLHPFDTLGYHYILLLLLTVIFEAAQLTIA